MLVYLMVKEKLGNEYLVKSGTGEPILWLSRCKIDFSPGNFVVLILKCMKQIRKNVGLFNG
jgi:hypothetical protein